MSDFSQTGWWRSTRRLAAIALGVAVVLALFFLSMVDAPDADGYPLGLVAAAIGIPVGLGVVVFAFARRQEALDRRNGLFER